MEPQEVVAAVRMHKKVPLQELLVKFRMTPPVHMMRDIMVMYLSHILSNLDYSFKIGALL